jgi:hypothetical protein
MARFRNKTGMPQLQQMLPADLLDYCQEHGLLESVLLPEGTPPPFATDYPPAAAMPASQDY